MPAQAVAARLLTARSVRRWLGCGCLFAVAAVALPLFLLFSVMSGALSTIPGVAGGSQVDGFAVGDAAMVVGSGEPLRPGSFTVSQGFGCTPVGVEPPPPLPYSCPPDGSHPTFLRFHAGIDLAAPLGTPVFAVAGATARVIDSPDGYGLHIVLSAAAGSTASAAYLYGHLSGVAVVDGEHVSAGQAIGFVGTSGNSTGPHLHFEVDAGSVPVNPCSVFPPGYLVPAGVSAAGCLAWST
jgi:murein DD-endopeptidase MepM/ murein hydrolase activator NlpD